MKNKSQVIWYLEAEIMLGHLPSSVTAESHAELQETENKNRRGGELFLWMN